MARIRTIKPEFWTSEKVVECSRDARLLFIGLWNFCDDGGVHPDSIKRIKMEVYPGDFDIDPENISRMLDELSTNGLIIRYIVEDKGYLHVCGWEEHQRIDKPTLKYPPPTHEFAEPFDDHSTNALPRKGREGKGREGKGKEGKGGELMSGKPDDRQPDDRPYLAIEYLNERTGRNFRPVESNLKFVRARIAEGYSLDDLKRVIDDRIERWTGTKFEEYLRPATLFNAEKFNQYAAAQPANVPSPAIQDWLNGGEPGDQYTIPGDFTRDE